MALFVRGGLEMNGNTFIGLRGLLKVGHAAQRRRCVAKPRGFQMNRISLVAALLIALPAAASAQDQADLRARAERGDAAAQKELADSLFAQEDERNGVTWLRKSAATGRAPGGDTGARCGLCPGYRRHQTGLRTGLLLAAGTRRPPRPAAQARGRGNPQLLAGAYGAAEMHFVSHH